MRYRRFIAVLALLALFGVGLARAQESGVDHVTLMEGELAPGASRVYRLKFGEGDLRRGWLFALVGQVRAGAAELTLLDPTGQPAAQWRWEPTDMPRWEGIAIPRDGEYRLRVASADAAPLRYSLYYDQSCFCAGKKLPLEGGVVIFQGSAAPGSPVEAWLATEDGVEISVQVAYRSEPSGRWPADYRVLSVTSRLDTRGDGSFRQESLAFTAESPDPYYLIVQGRKGTGGISFLAQEGDPGGTAGLVQVAPAGQGWLLWIAAAAAGVAVVALGLAARAWRVRTENRVPSGRTENRR
jgi:hypothetical protein